MKKIRKKIRKTIRLLLHFPLSLFYKPWSKFCFCIVNSLNLSFIIFRLKMDENFHRFALSAIRREFSERGRERKR